MRRRKSSAEIVHGAASRRRFTWFRLAARARDRNRSLLISFFRSRAGGRARLRKEEPGCFIDHLFHLCAFVMRRWAIFSISLLLAVSARAQQKSPPEPPGAGTTPTPSPAIAPAPAVIVAPPARPNGP